MSVGGRIREVRGYIPQKVFAEEIEVSIRSLIYYEKDERTPGADVLGRIAKAYNVSLPWLLTGDGEKELPTPRPEEDKSDYWKEHEAALAAREAEKKAKSNTTGGSGCDVDLVCVPRYEARLSAGNGSFITSGEKIDNYAFRADWIKKKGSPKSMAILGVDGASMAPEIQDNDIVMIDLSQTEIRPGRIYAVGVDEAILIKYIDIEPGFLILRSENPTYQPIRIEMQDKEKISILGRVVWSAREY